MDNKQIQLKTRIFSLAFKLNLLILLLGGLVLLVVGLIGGYVLRSSQIMTPGTKDNINEASLTTQISDQDQASPTPPMDENWECGKKECLMKYDNNYYGFAVLQGYYKQYDGTKWEWGNQQVTCDSLLPTGGSEKLITEFKEFIEAGNTINKIIDGNLLINIDLSELTSAERTLLEQSSLSKPVEIGIVTRFSGGRGVSTCYSFFDIVSVRSIANR